MKTPNDAVVYGGNVCIQINEIKKPDSENKCVSHCLLFLSRLLRNSIDIMCFNLYGPVFIEASNDIVLN